MGISDQIEDDYIAHSVDIERYKEDSIRNVLGFLEKLERDLVAQLSEIDPTAPARTSFQQKRLEQLLVNAKSLIKKAYSDMNKANDNQLIPLVLLEENFAFQEVNGLLGVDIMSTQLTPELINSIVSDTLIEGSPSSEWWSRQSDNLTEQFSDQMRMGVTQGETNNQLVQRIRGTATGKRHTYYLNGQKKIYSEFSGGIMDIGTRQAEALVRTSTQSIANTARLDVYKQNSDVIKGVQALVTLDNRTSLICMSRSGAVWDIQTGEPISGTTEQFPGPPAWHWQCRTTLIPVLKSWDELSGDNLGVRKNKKIDSIPESTQSSMDGQVAAGLSYDAWLKNQPKERQIEALGVTRYGLWKDDKLTFGQMISQTGRPLTIEEINNKYA